MRKDDLPTKIAYSRAACPRLRLRHRATYDFVAELLWRAASHFGRPYGAVCSNKVPQLMSLSGSQPFEVKTDGLRMPEYCTCLLGFSLYIGLTPLSKTALMVFGTIKLPSKERTRMSLMRLLPWLVFVFSKSSRIVHLRLMPSKRPFCCEPDQISVSPAKQNPKPALMPHQLMREGARDAPEQQRVVDVLQHAACPLALMCSRYCAACAFRVRCAPKLR